jgi:hypothetical protein
VTPRTAARRPAGARMLAIGILGAAVLALAALLPATAAALAPPALSVRAAILVEESTGRQLYGVAPNAQLPIASTTKMMTALVTLQHVRHLDTVFTAPNWYASSMDSQIGLAPGDQMTVHDLMLALMLPSADDAAEDLAYNVGDGSVARFVGMMNADARSDSATPTTRPRSDSTRRVTTRAPPISSSSPPSSSSTTASSRGSSRSRARSSTRARSVMSSTATTWWGTTRFSVSRRATRRAPATCSSRPRGAMG